VVQDTWGRYAREWGGPAQKGKGRGSVAWHQNFRDALPHGVDDEHDDGTRSITPLPTHPTAARHPTCRPGCRPRASPSRSCPSRPGHEAPLQPPPNRCSWPHSSDARRFSLRCRTTRAHTTRRSAAVAVRRRARARREDEAKRASMHTERCQQASRVGRRRSPSPTQRGAGANTIRELSLGKCQWRANRHRCNGN
jgi:hypothetical protein